MKELSYIREKFIYQIGLVVCYLYFCAEVEGYSCKLNSYCTDENMVSLKL